MIHVHVDEQVIPSMMGFKHVLDGMTKTDDRENSGMNIPLPTHMQECIKEDKLLKNVSSIKEDKLKLYDFYNTTF